MGFNGTWLACKGEGTDVSARLPRIVRDFYEAEGARFVSDEALSGEELDADPFLFGIAIAPSVDGWIAIADTERAPSAELAAIVAARLQTPVVLTSMYEICDPPEPEIVQVFGAEMSARFEGLYYLIGFGYAHLAKPREKMFGNPRFDRDAVVFLSFRGAEVRREPRPEPDPDDIMF